MLKDLGLQLSALHKRILAPSNGHQTYHKMVLTINTSYTFHTYYCGSLNFLTYHNIFVHCNVIDPRHFPTHIITCSNSVWNQKFFTILYLLWVVNIKYIKNVNILLIVHYFILYIISLKRSATFILNSHHKVKWDTILSTHTSFQPIVIGVKGVLTPSL